MKILAMAFTLGLVAGTARALPERTPNLTGGAYISQVIPCQYPDLVPESPLNPETTTKTRPAEREYFYFFSGEDSDALDLLSCLYGLEQLDQHLDQQISQENSETDDSLLLIGCYLLILSGIGAHYLQRN